ncbi:MAG: nuclear transport factor 2 family protein [Anaerolineae bacterium]|uniref:nuclear transport factor 2 family protein n=1 Tax=Candidatus Amarolinea dominans TaxID=3140696 RepID=UPI003134ABB5|nr:nuclear transport factor 2 family protein [Anaerolineae bacterium]MBK9233492.1 nuclear transport factor 2 family protein [Anaerolineae bacterium]
MKNNSAIPSVPQATPEDIQAITEASRDYAEGWFTANAEQMRRSLHPQLVKRTIWHDLQTGTWQPSNSHDAESMVGITRDGGGSALPESEKAFEIVVLDVFRDIATVKVYSYPYMDYLHLVKINDRWSILNCLYEVRVGEQIFA